MTLETGIKMAALATILMGLTTTLVIILSAGYLFLKRRFAYWEKKKIPHTNPAMPFGDLAFDKVFAETFAEIYNKQRDAKFFGFWMAHKPCIMINDPDLVKKILINDFSHFHDHGAYINVEADPLNNHLFFADGQHWKNLRSKISPAFSSGKMKNMFPIIDNIFKSFYEVLDPMAANGEPFDVRDMVSRYATDVIGNIAFGIDTNTLKDPDSIFRTMGKKIFAPTLKNTLKMSVLFFLPDIAKALKVVQHEKDVTQFFLNLVKDTMDYREKNNVTRNDILQLLMQLMKKGVLDDVIDKEAEGQPFKLEDAAAQAFLFFVGGFETTSASMQLTLYHLAENQTIQDKLREEIRGEMKKTGGKMTYESIFNLKYGGMILEESQRLYPQGAAITRVCTKDYPVEGSDFVIEKGTPVYVSIMGLHHDPRHFPNPKVFDPERFTEEEKSKRHSHAYLAFGDGPRFCIGQRFAMMQMRAILFSLIARYKFEFSANTPKTIKFDAKSIILAPKEGLQLKITRIDQ